VRYFLLFMLCIISLESAYVRPPSVEVAVWRKLSPHFLPESHPLKPKLDKLFLTSRVVQTSETLLEAGFENPYPRPFSLTIVTKHPKLKGYIFKLFTDSQEIEEWPFLHQRLRGAHLVRKAIKKHGFEEYFKVPEKWIYPLRADPESLSHVHKTYFILIAEDMNVLKKMHNYAQWAGATMTPKHLDAFYTIVQEVGLSDSVHAFNAPFCKDGKIAFIDTQHFHTWPVPLQNLTRYLTKRLQPYWEKKGKDEG